jgi:hypothetical protein
MQDMYASIICTRRAALAGLPATRSGRDGQCKKAKPFAVVLLAKWVPLVALHNDRYTGNSLQQIWWN